MAIRRQYQACVAGGVRCSVPAPRARCTTGRGAVWSACAAAWRGIASRSAPGPVVRPRRDPVPYAQPPSTTRTDRRGGALPWTPPSSVSAGPPCERSRAAWPQRIRGQTGGRDSLLTRKARWGDLDRAKQEIEKQQDTLTRPSDGVIRVWDDGNPSNVMRECGTEQGHAHSRGVRFAGQQPTGLATASPLTDPVTGCRVSSTEPPGPGQQRAPRSSRGPWSATRSRTPTWTVSRRRCTRVPGGVRPASRSWGGCAPDDRRVRRGRRELRPRHPAAGRAPVHLQRRSRTRRLPDAPARARARPRGALRRGGRVSPPWPSSVAPGGSSRSRCRRAPCPSGCSSCTPTTAPASTSGPRAGRGFRQGRHRDHPGRWDDGWAASWTRDWPCPSVTGTVSTRRRAW